VALGGSVKIAHHFFINTNILQRAALNLDASLNQLRTSITLQMDAMKAKTEASATKKGPAKLLDFQLKMFLNLSEPLLDGTTDDNGDIVEIRKEVTDPFKWILQCSSVGQAQTVVHHILNNEYDCNCRLPSSTVMAIYHLNILWSNVMTPGPFSIMACYHQSMDACLAMDSTCDNALAQHLCLTEGSGLLEADISSVTKLVLYPPTDVDVFTKMIGVMTMVLACIGGPSCLASLALKRVIDDVSKHEMVYCNMASADSTFCLRLACFLDHRLQEGCLPR